MYPRCDKAKMGGWGNRLKADGVRGWWGARGWRGMGSQPAASTREVGQARHSESAKSSCVAAAVTAARNERAFVASGESRSGGAGVSHVCRARAAFTQLRILYCARCTIMMARKGKLCAHRERPFSYSKAEFD